MSNSSVSQSLSSSDVSAAPGAGTELTNEELLQKVAQLDSVVKALQAELAAREAARRGDSSALKAPTSTPAMTTRRLGPVDEPPRTDTVLVQANSRLEAFRKDTPVEDDSPNTNTGSPNSSANDDN